MRDLFFVGFLAALLAGGLKRPFLFVLAYAYVDIVSPQRLSYWMLNSLPISLIVFALALIGWLVADRKVAPQPRQWLLVLLVAWCGMTTMTADFPIEALGKWDWVWKALLFAIFLPFTLTTRLRIEALLLVATLSASTIIIVGGIKTLASGGGYGALNLMVENNSGLYESSTIACIAIAFIPVILWLMKHGTVFPPDWRVRLFGYALIFACLLIPVGTQARTGLVCIAVLAVLLLRDVKRRLLYLGLLGAAGALAVPLMPSTFTTRMETIGNHKADESATTRLAVWSWTWEYAGKNPMGGGFDAYRGNTLRIETQDAKTSGAVTSVDTRAMTDVGRAYHSAYFEMLGEQGFPGLILFLMIHGIGLVRMEVLRRRHRGSETLSWASPLATAFQNAHIVYLVGAAFVGIAFQPFVYMLVAAQIGFDAYLKRCARAVQPTGFPIARPQPA